MATTIHLDRFTWEEFIDRVKAQGVSKSGRTVRPEFNGCSFEDALTMATGEGFKPETPNVDELLQHIETELLDRTMTGFDTYFDVAGSVVDMSRFLAGDPECMMESVPIKVMRTGRVISVGVVVNVAGAVSPNSIINRGAAIMALLDCFNRMQHPVEINAVLSYGSDNGRERVAAVIKVQDANQPLDMGRVMYALAHPSMPRQLGFSYQHSLDYRYQNAIGTGNGYGYGNRYVEPADLEGAPENLIILPELQARDRWDEASSVAWIRQQLAKIEQG